MIARDAWVGDYNDPDTFLNQFVTGSPQNNPSFSNTEYDALILEATKTTDNNLRFAAFAKAEKILLAEMPVIPLYYENKIYLLQTDVKGWYPTVMNIHPLKNVYLAR